MDRRPAPCGARPAAPRGPARPRRERVRGPGPRHVDGAGVERDKPRAGTRSENLAEPPPRPLPPSGAGDGRGGGRGENQRERRHRRPLLAKPGQRERRPGRAPRETGGQAWTGSWAESSPRPGLGRGRPVKSLGRKPEPLGLKRGDGAQGERRRSGRTLRGTVWEEAGSTEVWAAPVSGQERRGRRSRGILRCLPQGLGLGLGWASGGGSGTRWAAAAGVSGRDDRASGPAGARDQNRARRALRRRTGVRSLLGDRRARGGGAGSRSL